MTYVYYLANYVVICIYGYILVRKEAPCRDGPCPAVFHRSEEQLLGAENRHRGLEFSDIVSCFGRSLTSIVACEGYVFVCRGARQKLTRTVDKTALLVPENGQSGNIDIARQLTIFQHSDRTHDRGCRGCARYEAYEPHQAAVLLFGHAHAG